jgi:TonB family protein
MTGARYIVSIPAFALRYDNRHVLLVVVVLSTLLTLTPPLFFFNFRRGRSVLAGRDCQKIGMTLPGLVGLALGSGLLISGPPPIPPQKNIQPSSSPEKFGLVPVLSPSPDDTGEAGWYGIEFERFIDSKSVGAGGGGAYIKAIAKDTNVYSLTDAVERAPEFVWMKEPDYPLTAKRAGTEGNVILHILVDQFGKPIQVVVRSEKPANFGFGPNAARAAEQAVFVPAIHEAHPVKCWVELKVDFVQD